MQWRVKKHIFLQILLNNILNNNSTMSYFLIILDCMLKNNFCILIICIVSFNGNVKLPYFLCYDLGYLLRYFNQIYFNKSNSNIFSVGNENIFRLCIAINFWYILLLKFRINSASYVLAFFFILEKIAQFAINFALWQRRLKSFMVIAI